MKNYLIAGTIALLAGSSANLYAIAQQSGTPGAPGKILVDCGEGESETKTYIEAYYLCSDSSISDEDLLDNANVLKDDSLEGLYQCGSCPSSTPARCDETFSAGDFSGIKAAGEEGEVECIYALTQMDCDEDEEDEYFYYVTCEAESTWSYDCDECD